LVLRGLFLLSPFFIFYTVSYIYHHSSGCHAFSSSKTGRLLFKFPFLMVEELAFVLLTSFKIMFVYVAMKEGMIFHFVPILIEHLFAALLPAKNWALTFACYARKPLYGCVICMSSIWGVLFSLNRFSFSVEYLFFLFAVGGLNYLFDSIIAKQNAD